MPPAPTERARRFFGADLSRKRHGQSGQSTETKMSEKQLSEFASRGKMKHNDHGRTKSPRGHRE